MPFFVHPDPTLYTVYVLYTRSCEYKNKRQKNKKKYQTETLWNNNSVIQHNIERRVGVRGGGVLVRVGGGGGGGEKA